MPHKTTFKNKNSLLKSKKTAFIFEFDNVLYPEKDYLLQIYYLFTQFLEFELGITNARAITDFMKENHENGEDKILEKTLYHFDLSFDYRENFNRLMMQAKLLLPLILYPDALKTLKKLSANGKKIFLLTAGNPLVQLNKIKQTVWEGLEKEIKIYFTDEIKPKPSPNALLLIINSNHLNADDVIFIGISEDDRQMAISANISYQSVKTCWNI